MDPVASSGEFLQDKIPEAHISLTDLVTKLRKCGIKRNLKLGRHLHSKATESGHHNNIYVASTLISMYSKCRSMEEARYVFENMIKRNAVAWTSLIHGYVENGENKTALDLFNRMDCAPDRVTFVAALKACSRLATENSLEKKFALEKGLHLHRKATDLGFDDDAAVANTLVDMYSKLGEMAKACSVFHGMSKRNVISWNALILGFVENREFLMALEVLERMDCAPDRVTFVAALKACARVASSEKLNKEGLARRRQLGVRFHWQARDLGFDRDIVVANALVDMYSKCGDMVAARCVFDGMLRRDVVSWTTLIVGYAENGRISVALGIFENMDCAPNLVTFVAAIKACAKLASFGNQLDKESCLQKGLRIHRQASRLGFDKDIFVGNALVDMYSKCRSMADARYVFQGMIRRDVVSWNTFIQGYMENGNSYAALEIFNKMDCDPDHITFIVALKACASTGALELGREIHDHVCKLGLEQNEKVANSLIHFYGKCCTMAAAEEVFHRLRFRSVVSWTALIGGYSSLGDVSQVLRVVKKMRESGLQMDSVTMLLLLSAFGRAGMVEEAQIHFESMAKLGISPMVEHYSCMVDMLGRANRLEEALSLVNRMPFSATSVVWTALLGACRKWNNVKVGEAAFDALVKLNEDERSVAAACVLMGNIYKS